MKCSHPFETAHFGRYNDIAVGLTVLVVYPNANIVDSNFRLPHIRFALLPFLFYC